MRNSNIRNRHLGNLGLEDIPVLDKGSLVPEEDNPVLEEASVDVVQGVAKDAVVLGEVQDEDSGEGRLHLEDMVLGLDDPGAPIERSRHFVEAQLALWQAAPSL